MEYFSSSPSRSCRYLNDHIITNILSFLPAKSAVKIKCFGRSIYLLASEEFFAVLQARRAETTDSGFFAAYKYGANICFVDELAGIPNEAFKFLSSTARILSSANGLIFYFDRNLTVPSITVYNPVLRTSLSIPRPPGTEKLSHNHNVGIGAVVLKNFDYKIVYVKPGSEWNDNMHCKIYDSRDCEWKFDVQVDGGRRNLRLDEPVVCGSTVFWVSDCGAYMSGVDPYVVAVDVGAAAAAAPRSRIVPLPAEAAAVGSSDKYEIRIARWPRSGLLCLIQYRKVTSVFALWLFNTNEVDSAAWKKICEVGLDQVAGHEQVASFTLINCELLVFITVCGQLYSYSLSSRQLKKLGSVDSPYSALIPYANTLRPCGRDNNV